MARYKMKTCGACGGSGRRTCSECKGKGKISVQKGDKVDCKACSGSGKVKIIEHWKRKVSENNSSVWKPYTEEFIVPCDKCKGRGWQWAGNPRTVVETCRYCNGSGREMCTVCGGRGKVKTETAASRIGGTLLAILLFILKLLLIPVGLLLLYLAFCWLVR